MFKVCSYVDNELIYLGSTFNEGRVIEIMQEFLTEEVHFEVYKQLNDSLIPYKSILSEQEFIEYADEYSERISNNSCVGLKREILDLEEKRRSR